jgi:hypothetical protein
MKRKTILTCSLLIVFAVLFTTGILAGCTDGETEKVTVTEPGATSTVTVTETVTATKTVTEGGEIVDGTIRILNPATVSNQVERVPLAPRLDTLEGKSIYLIDVNWGSGDLEGAYMFLTLTAEWLEQEYNCTTKVVKKKGAYFFGDPDLFAEAGENADAVVFGVSG